MKDIKLVEKKLLILGATPNEIPLVKRAQQLGIYVIVTDYNVDLEISPAKKVADEYWNVSWSDIDLLEKKCKENHVDGVLAGFSEIRAENQIKLCTRLNLPCYISEEQLAITRDKELFKSKCREYDVPTIKEYSSIEEVYNYPVIVKPTDRAGSIGVGIAYNKQELEEAYNIALEKSLSKKVIIEEYVTNSTEMDAHYAIIDGNIFLLTTDDIIQAKDNKRDGKVVQSAWLYPSKYHELHLDIVDSKIRNMIQGMGIKNGTIFFSAFANEKDGIRLFECGFRLWGVQEFTYDKWKGYPNYLDIYIYHSLLGDCSNLLCTNVINHQLKGVSLNLYVKGGTISKLDGINDMLDDDRCFIAIEDSYLGQKCSFDAAILTKAGLIGFADENPQILIDKIKNAYSTIKIIDSNGQDMIYDYIDCEQLLSWWRK